MILHYIDNEPASGEWTFKDAPGASTITRNALATFPGRGSYGLRQTTAGTAAYVQKDTTHTISPGESFFVGFWLRNDTLQPEFTTEHMSMIGASTFAHVTQASNGYIAFYSKDDASSLLHLLGVNSEVDQWIYIVIEIQRATTDVASDGEGRSYVNGLQIHERTGIDNYDACGSTISVTIGGKNWFASGMIADYDEIKIATTYPEPFVPTPISNYLSPQRICILYAYNYETSRVEAAIIRAQLGIPCANVIPYNAPVSLTSYADYTSYVTDSIDEVFANHPAVASNCMCFLLAHTANHTFIEGGVVYSTSNWLMNYGGAPTPQLTNPHYQTKTRLTKADLAGKYMAAVLPLDYYSQMLDGADTIAALDELPDADTIYSDDGPYLASLPAQKLRIETSSESTFTDDAFVFGDTGLVGNLNFGSAGSRIAWVDPSDNSALHLEDFPGDNAATLNAAFVEGYIAGLGSTGPADTIDAETFFEVLRIGTFAEAAFASCEYLKSTTDPVGSPLLTSPFQTSGYNVYRGKGPLVDWSAPVAYLRKDVGADGTTRTATLVTTHDNSTQYTYGLRAVRLNVETPGYDQTVDFTTDSGGDWVGNRPVKVVGADAKTKSGGDIRVTWRYEKGFVIPDFFSIWFDTVEPDGSGVPDATVDFLGVHYSHTFTLSDGQTYYFRIVAVASGVESDPVIIGPYLADSTAPTKPTLTTSTSF